MTSPPSTSKAQGYHVYPLNVSNFYDLPPSLQNALSKTASRSSSIIDELPSFADADSFEYLTREGQHVVRVNFAPQYISLSPSEDKAAVSYLAKISDASKSKGAGGGGRTAKTKKPHARSKASERGSKS